MALLALLSLTWQSLVVQTHVHVPDGVSARAALQPSQATPRLSRDERPADPPLDCPICRQIGQAGAYLTPTPIAVHVPVTAVAVLPIALLVAWRGRRHSHGWRSRGPPEHLQNP